MWRWLDPIECRIAEQCLAHGQTLEAAKHLLAGSHREHKSVRDMLMRIGPQLVEQARQALEAGDVMVAGELIACAAQCGELSPEAKSLREKIERACDHQRNDEQWRLRRLQVADAWVRQGRLQSALGLVEPVADQDQDAARRKRDWAEAAGRLDRYVRQFQDYLAQGQFDAAEAILRKAQEAAPGQPQVLCLEQALREARPDRSSSRPPDRSCVTPTAAPPQPIETRPPHPVPATRLLLSGLPAHGDVLIVRQPVVLVGTAKDPWVQIPMQAMLHRRHAVILREETRECGVRYRIAPLAGCAVAVNGVAIPDGQTQRLADGDVVQFGSEHCRWTFRHVGESLRDSQPVSERPAHLAVPLVVPPSDGAHRLKPALRTPVSARPGYVSSSTAVLEQARPASACALAPDGTQVRCIVLAGDELVIGTRRESGHLVERDLPVRQLQLRWRPDGLHVATEGGVLFVNDGTGDDVTGRSITLPAQIVLYAEGRHLAAEALLGADGEYELKLQLRGFDL